jgi:hypothetical protein
MILFLRSKLIAEGKIGLKGNFFEPFLWGSISLIILYLFSNTKV